MENINLVFGHVEFELSMGYPGAIQQAVVKVLG